MSDQALLEAIFEQMKALTRAVNDARNERLEDRRLLAEAVGVVSRFDDRLREITNRIARVDVRLGEESAELNSIGICMKPTSAFPDLRMIKDLQ